MICGVYSFCICCFVSDTLLHRACNTPVADFSRACLLFTQCRTGLELLFVCAVLLVSRRSGYRLYTASVANVPALPPAAGRVLIPERAA